MSLLGLALVCLTVVLTAAQNDFSRLPESQIVDLGLDAVFRCQHPGAFSIGWLVDGVPVNRLNDSGMFVKPGNYRDEDSSLVYTLTILARPEYNGTMVECVATFLDNVPSHQRSPPVTLTIEDTCGSLTVATAFTILPMLGVFADGSEAKFRCHHRRSNRVTFNIDGLSLNDSLVENASVVRVPAGNGRSEFILTFEADIVLDGSMIVCVAIFTNGCDNQETVPALLLIQGPLSTVTQFRRRTSNHVVYSWTPPPTLDLTDVNPDVVYSIEIYNNTCGANDLLSTQNNLNISLYQNALLDPKCVYRVVIVPRSNVAGARNGTTFIEYERFGEINISSAVLTDTSLGVEVEFGLQASTDGIGAKSYSLLIHSLDVDNPEITIVLDIDEATVHDVLPRRERWFMSAFAYGCEEHQVANTTISTHDVQDASVSPIAGGISVTGRFIDNSSAVGVLLITFSFTNKDDIHYIFIQRPSEPQEIEAALTGFSVGDHQVSIFVVDDSGLPFNRSATLPSNVSVSEVNGTADMQSVISFELQATSTGVCITCTFLDSSTTDCVAVVHQRISQLSSSGLMNIESSHKFNRSGDTAYGCIEGIDMEQCQIGVVGGHQNILELGGVHPENDSTKFPVVVVAAVVGSTIMILITTIILLLILLMYKKYPNIKERYQHSKRSSKDNKVANSDDSAIYINGASPSVPHQVENKKNPSKVMYVPTFTEATSPQDSVPDEESPTSPLYTEIMDKGKPKGEVEGDRSQPEVPQKQLTQEDLRELNLPTLPSVPQQNLTTEDNQQMALSTETSNETNTELTTSVQQWPAQSQSSCSLSQTPDPSMALSAEPAKKGDPLYAELAHKKGKQTITPPDMTGVQYSEIKTDEHKKRPQPVSHHGNIPGPATSRPTQLDNKPPPTDPELPAAELNFVQPSIPKTEEESYSAQSDMFHSDPVEEVNTHESSL